MKRIAAMDNHKKGIREKRQSPRISTTYTTDYALFDEKGSKTGRGKGQMVNLSQGGALLRTPEALRGTFIVLVSIDLKGQKIKVQGRIVRTVTGSNTDGFLIGIEFIAATEKQREAILAFVKSYHQRKKAADKPA